MLDYVPSFFKRRSTSWTSPIWKVRFLASIQIFHTPNIILADKSKFNLIGFIPEVMFRDVPATSDVLWDCRNLPVTGFCPLTDEMQKVLMRRINPRREERIRVRNLVHLNQLLHLKREANDSLTSNLLHQLRHQKGREPKRWLIDHELRHQAIGRIHNLKLFRRFPFRQRFTTKKMFRLNRRFWSRQLQILK